MSVERKLTPYTIVDKKGRARASTFGRFSYTIKFDGQEPQETEKAWKEIREALTLAGILRTCREVADGLLAEAVADNASEQGALAWFGAQLRQQAEQLSAKIDTLKPDTAVQSLVREAFALGSLFRAALRRRDFEDDSLRGAGTIKSASSGGWARAQKLQSKIRKKRARWQAIADDIWLKNPKMKKASVARRVEKMMGDPYETIRRAIKEKR